MVWRKVTALLGCCAVMILTAGALRAGEGFLPANTADLPDRCAVERLYLDLQALPWKENASHPATDADPDSQALGVLSRIENPDSPDALYYVAYRTDYYRRRAEVQEKIERRSAALPEKERLKQAQIYAFFLLYLGDFQKLVDHFGPKAADRRLYERDGLILFALSQAHFRLGEYERSLPIAEKAFALLPSRKLDVRWQIMMTDLAIQKDAFFQRPSKYYVKKHIKALYPNRSWASMPFEIVTDKMGIDKWGGTGAASFADLDGDGFDELLIQRKFFPPKIYRNQNGAAFLPLADSSVESTQCSQIVQTVVDYNNDGRPDIHRHCCNFDGPGNSFLFENAGEMTFRDVTKKSGLEYHSAGMQIAWGDYDLDGNLDMVASDMWGPTRLFHNEGNGTFLETTQKAGVQTPGGAIVETAPMGQDPRAFGAVGCAFGDYSGDGYPDLFCSGWGWSRLFKNNGDGTFADVTKKAGVSGGEDYKGWNVFFFDYDNDGKLDFYVGRYMNSSSERWGWRPRCTCSNLLTPAGYSQREMRGAGTIYRNNGDGTFSDMNAKTMFTPLGVMSTNHSDWDNDGDQDLVMGTGGPYMQQAEPFLFYQNKGDGTFSNITPFTMLPLWGKGHGLAFADYDHDGQLDLFLNNGGAFPGDIWPSLLLHNKGNANHWLEISLKAAEGGNRFGVGARVLVHSGKLRQLQELAVGGRFSSVNSLRLHFGLAKNAKVDKIEVRWPNFKRTLTVIQGVAADQAIEISEADGTYRQLWAGKAAVQTSKPAPAMRRP